MSATAGSWTNAEVARNMYLSPSSEFLERRINERYVLGTVRVSEFEIKTSMTHEHAFIALLSARLQATLDEMAELICFTTFPVHDEPLTRRELEIAYTDQPH